MYLQKGRISSNNKENKSINRPQQCLISSRACEISHVNQIKSSIMGPRFSLFSKTMAEKRSHTSKLFTKVENPLLFHPSTTHQTILECQLLHHAMENLEEEHYTPLSDFPNVELCER